MTLIDKCSGKEGHGAGENHFHMVALMATNAANYSQIITHPPKERW